MASTLSKFSALSFCLFFPFYISLGYALCHISPSARRHGRTRSLPFDANTLLSYILLAPKDKDHYSPILDLERTLYTIIERE